jgi:hypothetical protein
MKTFFALVALLCFASTAHAEVTPRLSAGNWILGGSTNLQFPTSGPAAFTMSPEVEYFVASNLAAGLSGYFSAPEFTIHTKASDTVVPYLTIKPFEVGGGSTGSAYYSTAGRVGVKFFLTDSVAFGPAFEERHYWPSGGYGSSNSGVFYGVFSIHI